MTLNVVTNHNARPILFGWEIAADERAELDYVDWQGVDEGAESFSGFRYRGWVYDLSEFEPATGDIAALGYDGFQSSSYFDGIAVRYVENYEGIVVAHIHW